MKPTPWKLVIVVGALCGAGAAAAGQDTSKASGATLLVNDSDALGQQGDDRLALAEAIRLANGGLALAQLSVSERRQVRGVPGVGRADRIRFAVKERVVRFPLQIAKKPEMDFAVLQTKSFMPVLAGNGGDEIDGKGVRFTNGPDDATDTVNAQTLTSGAPLGGAALVIESSDFTIRNAQFERFIDGLIFRPATGAASMTNVRVINNQFHKGGGIAFSGVSAGHERSALRNILIEGNTFLGPAHFGGSFPSKLHTAIAVTGATAAVAKGAATAKDVVVEDVQISRNTVRAFAGGVQVQPLQTLFAANRGAVLNRLHISGNDIALDPEAGDPAVYIWGAVSVNGQVSDVRVTGIRIENNKVLGNGHVLFIAGVEALMGGMSRPATSIWKISGLRRTGSRPLNPAPMASPPSQLSQKWAARLRPACP
ncbi:hypothetical protein [Sphingobium herbicidovorans]|uniref:hypothetical protein n=1 Tax=Sphingobium herbicidovorans TaxID=76947 RepID=UPI0009DA7E44|nr:hypothetical protein [Sphingobium herbicidovorans]